MHLKDFNTFLRDLNDLNHFNGFSKGKHVQHETPYIIKKCQHKRFNPIWDLDEQIFRVKYRFTKENMRKIIEMLRDDLESEYSAFEVRTNQVPVDLQIMAAIRFWGFSESQEITATAHGVNQKTLSKICKRVAAALSSKASRYIRMPATLAEKERVTSDFETLSCMPHVIGALDHASVKVRYNNFETLDTTDTSEDNHIHIQIISDFSLKIRDLDCKFCSTSSEECTPSEIFTHTRIKERFEQNEFRGRVLLGGQCYSCTPYLMTPVCGAITQEDTSFNVSHAATFAPAVKCLNVLKCRFKILDNEIFIAHGSSARHVIVALALLHNMAVDWNDQSLDIE